MQKLPEKFDEVSLTALAPGERQALLEVLEAGEAARGMRLRPGITVEQVAAVLPGPYEPIPWAKNAYYITADSRAGAHPLHAAGAYYLQEPSAMAAVPRLDVRPGQRVLDMCAAPGGKSTQIAALLAGEGVLVANEIVPSRAKTLSQNIERMGVANAIVTCEAPDKLARAFGPWFDRILVDAPCSGEGMFRRDPDTRAEWTPEAPVGCAQRQRQVLRAATALLREGGRLVYSTCTFNEIENEGVVLGFLEEFPEFILEEMERLWPHKVRGEGHFVAAMRKGEPQNTAPCERGAVALDTLLPGFPAVPGRPSIQGGMYWALPSEMPDLHGIRALRTGLLLGEMRGKVFIPNHALAMAFAPGFFPMQCGVSEEQALRYLHGETLPGEGFEKGWVVVAYQGLSLGWAKCADGVLKNHLPKGLRWM